MRVGNRSGGQPIISGFPWGSGPNLKVHFPRTGVQLRWSANASGYCYIGLSGGMTVNSGGVLQSGTDWVGVRDGMQLVPGDAYFVPRIGTGRSGLLEIFATCDAAASGQGRLYFEIY